jgi:hypothetical protein
VGDNIDTMKKNTETLINAGKKVGIQNKYTWSRNIRRENEVYVAVSSTECRSTSGHKNSKQIV